MYPRLTDLLRDFLGIDPPFDLYTYGLMLATAILLATWLTRIELDRMYRIGLVGPVEIREPGKKGRTKTTKASPSVLIWTMMLLAAFFGVAGAKLFHIFDNFGDFMTRPGAYLLTADGLAFYGGMIVAALALAYYCKLKGVHIGAFLDAVAPGLMLAYGVGRIGCYLAGDGDWGICSSLADKPAWIPGFLWSETFPNNYLGRDLLAECGPGFDGVYPTMLYEFALGVILAGVLWGFRKHLFKPGWLFSFYLVLAGLERFAIEQIRTNVVWFDIAGFEFTQAMIISVFLVIGGAVAIFVLGRRRDYALPKRTKEENPAPAA
jgi:phosphatidylglycerol---prolipoprotein diacylglyceryl transferase